jgi:recombination protein RecA
VDVDAVPTGALSLDLALGIGGVPRGRVVEIFGGESSGKTTLALHIVAEAQKKGGICAFVDAEHAMDPEYAGKIGVNMKDLLISQPDSGEQALQIVETLVNSKAVDVIVVDSVAALTPKAEIEGEIGDQHIALQARLMSQACRKLTSILAKTNTIIIFLNQTRMKIGIMFGDPTTTPGGMALKFYSSVRINLKRIAQIKKGENAIGSRVKAQIVKNKVAAPFRTAEFDIYWDEGISKAADLLNLALKYGVVKKTGLTYYFGQQKMGQGLEGIKEFFKVNPKAEEEIRKAVLEKAKSSE